jgi:PAS domain S-box-containing protein
MSKASIAVIEDEGIVALEIRTHLEASGYDIAFVAVSGEEALQKISQSEPDLVVLDIRLRGELSGIDVARRVHATHGVPVIYLTAHSDPDTLEKARETEPCGYLVKPFDGRALEAAIEICLYKSERSRQAKERARWSSAIPDSIVDAVFITDDKGVVKFTNPAAVRLLGTGSADLLNQRLADVLALRDAGTGEPVLIPVTQPLAEGRPADRRVCIVAGSETRVELTASPLLSPEGTVFGLLYVLR